MSQLKEITFYTIAGGEQTVKVQHYESTTDLEFWGENDRAVSGKIRHNLRGARGKYRLSYDHSTEATIYRSVLNNIMADLSSGEESITISEGSSLSGARVVVPTEEFRQQLEYVNQISGFMPVMEFVDNGLNRLASRYVDAGYVTGGYVE